jgi:hypothetical protein
VTYYVYKTTCLPTGKYYYGVHSERRSSDGYIGCGVVSQGTALALKKKNVKSAFIDSVVKYGYKSFQKEIIAYFETAEEAYEVEELIVDEEEVKNKMCLNTRLGGVGGAIESTKKRTVIIDCHTNTKIEFSSKAECEFFIGIKNMSNKSRMSKNRYVREEKAEPVKLVDEKGNAFDFMDIYSCRFILGLSVDKVRMVMRGERNSVGTTSDRKNNRYSKG